MDAAAIARSGTPVLCIDTCAVLDLMRDPTRDTAKPSNRKAGFNLIEIAERGGLTILMAEQVAIEFAAHDVEVQDEARRNLQKVREQLTRIEAVAREYGAQGAAQLAHLDDHVDRARALVERWIRNAKRVTPSDAAAVKAFTRVNALRAPAAQGKDSSKDCLVFETYLEAVAGLRAAGCVAQGVFVSSNTRDYIDSGSVMKPDISADLTPLSMGFAVSIEHAKNALGL